MKNIFTRLLVRNFFTLLSLFITQPIAHAQHVPERFTVSADGKRLTTGGTKPSTGFYDESTVKNVELTFAQADYWQQLTSNYASKTSILASLTYDGKVYPNVGVRFRGNTSYQRVTGQKKSFSIEMDFKDSTQDLKGYKTLHFNNAFEDPTMMREVLYLGFERRHVPAAKGNFIHLYINGQDWGEYPNIQVLNGAFAEEWFLSKDGTRWRAEPPTGTGGGGGGGGFGAGKSSLNFLGTDTTLYKTAYTVKKANKTDVWTDLVKACQALNTPVEDDLKKVFDTDRALWFVANEIIFGDDDSYVNKGGQDYYVFWDKETGRIVPIEYDGNSAFNSTARAWSPFLKETNVQFPLMNKLFAVPALRQRYLAHVRTIIEEILDSSVYNPTIDIFAAKIDALVNADPKKNTTYAQFQSGVPALKTWLNNRRINLLANSEVNRVAPTVSDVVYATNNTAWKKPDAGQSVVVTAKAAHSAGISRVNLYYGTGLDGYFDKTQMFDDGAHGDGAANDGTFGGTIVGFTKGSYVRFYVEAIANDAAKTVAYLPKGAEHDVFIYQVNFSGSLMTGVAVNEIMASNATTQTDQNGEFEDWIELFNKTSVPIDLSGFFLSDDAANRGKFKLPQGTTIPANGYLIVWADEDGSQTGLHANFKLSAAGEVVIFSDRDTAEIENIIFSTQQADKGYARRPNGTGNFVIQNPTFNRSNDLVPTAEILLPNAVRLFPNPTTEGVTIEVDTDTKQRVQAVNMLGQVVFDDTILRNLYIKTTTWQKGIYMVKIGEVMKKLVVN
ncbi:MAG: CotH kinase family protein [Saprospiraceae bacterium]|nr:CotH kinase family protein [Saprospiraceae bacterium]